MNAPRAAKYTLAPMRKSNVSVFRVFALVVAQAVASMPATAQLAASLQATTLAAAEDMLQRNNPDLALARRALEQSRADVLIAGQRPNPQLGVALQNINPNRGFGVGDLRGKTVDTIVRVDQLFERGGKAELRVETASRIEMAVGEDVNEMLRQQLLMLRTAYYDLLAAQEKVASSMETAQLFGKTLDAAQLRLKAGDLASADVARIRVDVLRAQNDVRTAEADLARARLAVGYLIGAGSNASSIRAVSPWPKVDSLGSTKVSEEQLADRADVRAARARIDAADKARELARAMGTRDVTIGAQYEHWPNQADANNQGTGSSFGIGVSMPLFVRHRFEGEIARAQADWYAAQDALQRTLSQARTEAERAGGDLSAARERLVRFDAQLLPEAMRSAAAAEFAFRNGAIGVMDLLDARRVLKAIQVDAANARADHAKALVAYDLGRGVIGRRE